MIIHVSSMRLKAEVTESRLAEVFGELESIAEDTPGVLEVHCGTNVSRHASDHTHVVFVRAVNEAALDAYRQHPKHRAMGELTDAAPRHDRDQPVIGADLAY